MSSPSEMLGSSRSRWPSQGRLDIPGKEIHDPIANIIQEQLADGWLLQETTLSHLVFSTILDGRKWKRFFDKRTCLFVSQEFHKVEEVAKNAMQQEIRDWPPVDFGD